jgi:hypothetical protein
MESGRFSTITGTHTKATDSAGRIRKYVERWQQEPGDHNRVDENVRTSYFDASGALRFVLWTTIQKFHTAGGPSNNDEYDAYFDDANKKLIEVERQTGDITGPLPDLSSIPFRNVDGSPSGSRLGSLDRVIMSGPGPAFDSLRVPVPTCKLPD